MKYGLFLGCNMPALRPDVERSIRLTMPALGVELLDLPGYVCCPAFGTFPSLDEGAQLAVNAWNLSIGEEHGVDLMVECGSCYSSIRTGCHLLHEKKERLLAANALLAKAGKEYKGEGKVCHVSDVLYSEVGLEAIRSSVKKPLEGLKAVVQYPCHTLFPSEIVGFEENATRPHRLADLVEALGAEVQHFSLEYQCCGGAGGFHTNSRHQAAEFTRRKLDAIRAETEADVMVVSCITCLMYLDSVQKELNGIDAANGNGNGNGKGNGGYTLPVLDYNQLLALAMDFAPNEVAGICDTPRDALVQRIQG